METIKINFCDFWSGFDKTDNYFYNLLLKKYTVEISENPEFIFYSCYGNEYLKFNCIRVFYTAENIRPDFTGCDYAISFDYIDRFNHYRLPLYALYIDHEYNGNRGKNLTELTSVKNRKTAKEILLNKTKFCSMVVSNPHSNKRLNFFNILSKYKHVDSGGKTMNNIGGPVSDKLDFIKDYKFVLAFENQSYPGYTTEKIIEPFFADCIPIYWGNPLVFRDFNKKRFIDYADFQNEEDLINRIIEIDNNDELAIDMLCEPFFNDNKIPEFIREENLVLFLDKIIKKKNIIPVSQTYKRFFHQAKRKANAVAHILKSNLKVTRR